MCYSAVCGLLVGGKIVMDNRKEIDEWLVFEDGPADWRARMRAYSVAGVATAGVTTVVIATVGVPTFYASAKLQTFVQENPAALERAYRATGLRGGASFARFAASPVGIVCAEVIAAYTVSRLCTKFLLVPSLRAISNQIKR